MVKLVGLSKWDEEEIIKELKNEALLKCDDVVKEYVECCKNSWIVWNCKPIAHRMNDCVRNYTTQDHMDRKRLDYMNRRKQ